jgi:hypothetical protein
MIATEPIFTKRILALRNFVNNIYSEFYENMLKV